MATHLATAPQLPPTRSCEPSLPAELIEPFEAALTSSYATLPVVSPDVAGAIPVAIAGFEQMLAPSSADEIERMVTNLSLLYPAAKLSDAEAGARVELYVRLLRDVPFDILSAAFKRVAQTSRFFPTVAEIREAAAKRLSERHAKIYALRQLLMKHRREYRAPVAELSDEDRAEVQAMLAGLSGRLRSGEAIRA